MLSLDDSLTFFVCLFCFFFFFFFFFFDMQIQLFDRASSAHVLLAVKALESVSQLDGPFLLNMSDNFSFNSR